MFKELDCITLPAAPVLATPPLLAVCAYKAVEITSNKIINRFLMVYPRYIIGKNRNLH
jgi:hypothetical protein